MPCGQRGLTWVGSGPRLSPGPRRVLRSLREQRRRTRAGFSGPEAAHVLLFVRSQFGCCEIDCRSCLKKLSEACGRVAC
jgi:hypothetical protein